MKAQININYNWRPDDVNDIPEGHKEALKEDAEDRIFSMIKKGYTSGELNTSVRYGIETVPEEDPEDGISYSGWWETEFDCDFDNQKEPFIEKLESMLPDVIETIMKRADNILHSGAVDPEDYNDEEFILTKILLVDALRHTADQYLPPHGDKEIEKEIKNISNF